jgi:DNA helicase II / ATP-dependent DNA helicase PcrA
VIKHRLICLVEKVRLIYKVEVVLSDEEKKVEIVGEEQEILKKILGNIGTGKVRSNNFSGYDSELIELRDAIAEALPEDIPSLVEQMTRLQAIAAQRGLGEDLPMDPNSPYFGHMGLVENGESRDVLLGKRTFVSPKEGIRIVDWRNAPVSRMYYCYDEGDEYEEIFGGKVRTGYIKTRRSVTITKGELRRIDCPLGTIVKKDNQWINLGESSAKLAGGQGTAIRAGKKNGKLGVDFRGDFRQDKHLPEISALLDKEQFSLISSDDRDLLAIQGSAGSGKTTVGLHRIAYLSYRKGSNLKPSKILVIVLNQALANYVKDVLPSLGVMGVKVETFERWASRMRMSHVYGLPKEYTDETPSVVSRAKKHPALLRILQDMVDEQDEKLTDDLIRSVESYQGGDRIIKAWNMIIRLPLDARRKRLKRWLDGEVRIGRDNGDNLEAKAAIAADSALARMKPITSDIISDWADLFTDRKRLEHYFTTHAPTVFSEADFDQIHAWCVENYKLYFEQLDDEDSQEHAEVEPVTLDREDDAILLRLYQLKIGWLKQGSHRLEYDHLMVDEVQDFSALEVKVVLENVGDKKPVTLAGDTAQKIVREGGFDDWESFIDELEVRGARIEPLKIAYRSTAEVMEIAMDVLGHLALEEPRVTRHGAPVELHQFSDPGQAVSFMGTSIRELLLREPRASVAVIARHPSQARMYYDGLKKAEIPGLRLSINQDFPFVPGVDVTDVRQVKGLEFDYVIMVECNEDTYSVNDESRHLMHVGMTRAAHQLWLVATSAPSQIIPARIL